MECSITANVLQTEVALTYNVSGLCVVALSNYYLNRFKWYRKWRKCTWYKHQFTNDALELSITFTGTWWALYGKINRYSDVVDTEVW